MHFLLHGRVPSMLKFMNNHVVGVRVTQHMIGAGLVADKERAMAGITIVEISTQVIKECRPYCQDIHIVALG